MRRSRYLCAVAGVALLSAHVTGCAPSGALAAALTPTLEVELRHHELRVDGAQRAAATSGQLAHQDLRVLASWDLLALWRGRRP